ncbi:MAG: hypothetical protein GY913_16100 [Proteobacteria bacterium]|nr:hypothetical protein [Pseudomonadota bacterium]MCP4918428.1 hypothetical protein [Pseudomonadota bacterium]
MLLTLLLACNPSDDPSWVAHQACIALPGLHMDGASQALAVEAIHPDELQIWHDDASYGTEGYGPVYDEIGLEGAGVIRANSYCTLTSLTDGVAVLNRREPDLQSLEKWDTEAVWELPRIEHDLTLQIVSTPDGYRALTGLADARARALGAERLVADDREDALAVYRALHLDFPDPRILWRIVQIEQLPVRAVPDGLDEGGEGALEVGATPGPDPGEQEAGQPE